MAAGSLSARGVAGELQLYDGHVPNYNIYGQQHHRVPTKDLSRVAKVPEKPEWSQTPRYRTRQELNYARRAAKHPDLSYDIDGDGVVSSTDYFIGKQFSSERDHALNAQERRDAVQALESGWLDNYSFGHDQAGAKRPYPVKQIRGKIISVDNIGDLCEVYPPHWNADKVPRFRTASDMRDSRKAEFVSAAEKIKAEHDAKFPAFVDEPPVPREPTPLVKGQSWHERQDARRREAREYAGLESDNTHVNPHREQQSGTTLEYHEVPHDTTRTAMRDRRRKEMLNSLHTSRRHGEFDYVPKIARHTHRDAVEYDERRPDPDAMTMNKLKHQRKVEHREYNMRNFKAVAVEQPRYADQSEPWWKLQKDYVHEPPSRCALKDIHDPVREVAPKVTEVDHARNVGAGGIDVKTILPSDLVSSSTEYALAHPVDEADHGTLKRWTTEFVPQVIQQYEPRYFDGVKQAPTYSMDTADLDQFSSFEVIAKSAIKRTKARQEEAAREDEERARAWKLSCRGLPDLNDRGIDDSSAIASGKFHSQSTLGATGGSGKQQIGSKTDCTQGTPGSRSVPPLLTQITMPMPQKKVKPEILDAQGADPSMSQRLDRALTARTHPVSRLGTVDEIVSARSGSPNSDVSRKGVDGAAKTYRKPPSGPGAGSRRTSVAQSTVDKSPKSQGIVVRSHGFQWIDRTAGNTFKRPSALQEQSSTSSLLAPPPRIKESTSDTPPRSRSISQTR
jgi:hypothetical protein